MPDSYDEVAYPSYPIMQSHPALVSALSLLAGLALSPIAEWNVLEIGCGDGSNILPLAFDYPKARFIGVDRAQNAIRAGQSLASRLHLGNIELQAADLLDWEPDREYDYIIAHGIFSWVPDGVRNKILKICGECLKPEGIAFISYNALPGCHFRRYAADFLRFHVRNAADPAARIEQAQSLARQVIEQPPVEDSLLVAVRSEMGTILEKDDRVLFHDDLADVNEPFYLLDFVAQAEHRGLQYLGDAEPRRDDVGGMVSQSADWIESRQYGDFLAGRRFRETLLCRQGIQLDRKPSLERFLNLFIGSRVRPGKPDSDGQQQFDLPKSGSLTTNHPFVKQTLCRLASLWPRSIRISELPLGEFPPEAIADMLMQLLRIEALELRFDPPRIASSVSQAPVASAFARAQISEGSRWVTNQRHMCVEPGDDLSRRILLLLDGSRDRQKLTGDLLSSGLDSEYVRRTLEPGLAALHALCLLTQ